MYYYIYSLYFVTALPLSFIFCLFYFYLYAANRSLPSVVPYLCIFKVFAIWHQTVRGYQGFLEPSVTIKYKKIDMTRSELQIWQYLYACFDIIHYCEILSKLHKLQYCTTVSRPLFISLHFARKMRNKCRYLLKYLPTHGNTAHKEKTSFCNSNKLKVDIWFEHPYSPRQPLLFYARFLVISLRSLKQ